MMDDFDAANKEVERLHDFLGAWFRGELAQDCFEDSFAQALHPGFENVQPAGKALTRDDMLVAIRNGHGANSDFRITIEQPRLLATWPELILFQYIEVQTGARSSPAKNRRLSTVLFEKNDNRLIWRYLTEVGLP